MSPVSVRHAASVMQTEQAASCKTPRNIAISLTANQRPVSAQLRRPMRSRDSVHSSHAKHLDCRQKPDTVFQPTIIFMMKTVRQAQHGIKDLSLIRESHSQMFNLKDSNSKSPMYPKKLFI